MNDNLLLNVMRASSWRYDGVACGVDDFLFSLDVPPEVMTGIRLDRRENRGGVRSFMATAIPLDGTPLQFGEIKAQIKTGLDDILEGNWGEYLTADKIKGTAQILEGAYKSLQLSETEYHGLQRKISGVVAQQAEKSIDQYLFLFEVYQADQTQLSFETAEDKICYLRFFCENVRELVALTAYDAQKIDDYLDLTLDEMKKDLRESHALKCLNKGIEGDALSARADIYNGFQQAQARAMKRYSRDYNELVAPNLPTAPRTFMSRGRAIHVLTRK